MSESLETMLSALFFLVPKMAALEGQGFGKVQDSRSRKDQLSALLTETRQRTLYGRLNLAQRIDFEKRNLQHCIIDAVKLRKQNLTEVLFDLGLYSLPYLCRRVDTRVKWHRGAVGRQLQFE